MKNGKQPINPIGDEFIYTGLSKREHFSILLMQSLVCNADRHSQRGDCQIWNYRHLSEIAIQGADALLAELEKSTIQK